MSDLGRSPIWAALRQYSARIAAQRDVDFVRSVAELQSVLGPLRVQAGRDWSILVARSAVDDLLRAFPDRRTRAKTIAEMVGGFRVYLVADWKMDPSRVATARLAAVLSRPLARVLRWIGRRHPAWCA